MNTLSLPAFLSTRGYMIYYTEEDHPEKHSHENLLSALSQYLHRSVSPEEVIRETWKKPRLSDGSIHFSVTHSGSFWLVCISPVPVGLDLQHCKDTYNPKVASRWFHPEELAFITDTRQFHRIWCARESYAKYTGLGVTGLPSDFRITAPPVPLYEIPFRSDYWLYLCTAK